MAAAAPSSAAPASSSVGGCGSPAAEAAAKENASFVCPICLEAFADEAYLDTCFHSFCYKCICQWVKIVTCKHAEPLSAVRCPLCKTENASIIHGLYGESFQRQYINQDLRKRHLSAAHELISQFYNTKDIPGNTPSVHQYWKQRKFVRKNIWLQTWLRWEIQALTQDEDVEVIVHHIHGEIESFMKRQDKEDTSKKISPEDLREEFKTQICDVARPFLLDRTERFVAEVELFMVSLLNIDAYNKVRIQRLRGSTSRVTRDQDVLPHDRSLEDHYFLYFVADDTGCNGEI